MTGARKSTTSPRTAQKVKIGARLRAARLSQKMTMEVVADASGLTKGFISRLENDNASPSVASLIAVCDAIGLRVGALFDPPDTAVVRSGEGKPINFGASSAVELLLTPGTQQQLEVIHTLLEGVATEVESCTHSTVRLSSCTSLTVTSRSSWRTRSSCSGQAMR